MLTRPDLADVPVGHSISINGELMTHLGGGQFQPARVEPLEKRFSPLNDEPLHCRWAAA